MAFPETKWTMLAQATLNGDAAGRAALEELCRRYWPAVRDFLVVRGYAPEEAEDAAQDFFASLMQSGGWHHADRARGRFRNFLLGALERTLVQRRRRATAQKRGGGAAAVSLEEIAEVAAEVPHWKKPSNVSPITSAQIICTFTRSKLPKIPEELCRAQASWAI